MQLKHFSDHYNSGNENGSRLTLIRFNKLHVIKEAVRY